MVNQTEKMIKKSTVFSDFSELANAVDFSRLHLNFFYEKIYYYKSIWVLQNFYFLLFISFRTNQIRVGLVDSTKLLYWSETEYDEKNSNNNEKRYFNSWEILVQGEILRLAKNSFMQIWMKLSFHNF